MVYPGGNDATVTLDSGDVTCAVTATSCTAVITRDDVYTVSLTVSNDVGSAPPVTKMFDCKSPVKLIITVGSIIYVTLYVKAVTSSSYAY